MHQSYDLDVTYEKVTPCLFRVFAVPLRRRPKKAYSYSDTSSAVEYIPGDDAYFRSLWFEPEGSPSTVLRFS